MGYITEFEIKFHEPHAEESKWLTTLSEFLEEKSGYYFSRESGYTLYVEGKWYDWDKHMLLASKLFPEQVLVITGVGEDRDDLWRTYFKDGKSQDCKARIEYDEYDEGKLK